jgi:hypothetical protein
MDTLTDRLTTWLLRFFATLMLFLGISLLVPALPLLAMPIESPVLSTIVGYFMEFGGAFALAGGTALYVLRSRRFLLPNEREAIPDAERPEIGGWLIALAGVLVALPVWLVIRLQPFLAEWGRVVDALATSGILEEANANFSGVILLPIFAALTPPLIELAAMAAFVVTSPILLLLLLLRRPRFPRLYLTSLALFAGLVIASVRGAEGAMFAAGAVQELMASSNASPEESAQAREIIGRYTSIVASTARVLVWTLVGNLVWLPALLTSRHVRTTFADRARAQTGATGIPGIEAITRPPR